MIQYVYTIYHLKEEFILPKILLKNVCKKYENNHYSVRNFNLEIEENDFIILVGPSGCGKSTTLRMIAGLEDISSGELWIDGIFSNYIDAGKRNMSMVFQNYALYPNLSVYDNIALALSSQKKSKTQIKETIEYVSNMLEINHLLDRKPSALSGGQKQRVAIGSSIARNPNIFLMDEPLSNLDAKLRSQLRIELAHLHKTLQTTIIYVTHDQTEAMTLGTKIVVMKDGEIQQIASPSFLYQKPYNVFVASFIGSPMMNFFDATIHSEEDEMYLSLNNTDQLPKESYCKVLLSEKISNILKKNNIYNSVIIGIRAEDFYFSNQPFINSNHQNFLSVVGKIEQIEYLGSEQFIHFTVYNHSYTAKFSNDLSLKTGEDITLFFDIEKIHIFDKQTQKNILFMEE